MKDRGKAVLETLKKTYPEANCALIHENPFQLLVSTILSAQCTDKRVNAITPALFKKYKTARDFAGARIPELEKMIHSAGFYRQKARWIKGAAGSIISKFAGKVPRTMEDLLSLTGVARKTANVVLGTGYGVSEGIVVDTHVKRVSKRLGLTRETDPVKVEKDLVRVIAKEDWIWFSHALITHGRQICKAPRPLCERCPLNQVCPSSWVAHRS